MKKLNTYITEKFRAQGENLDKTIDKDYKYFPKNSDDLSDLIWKLIKEQGVTDLNCIDTSLVKDFSYLFDDYDYPNVDISKWDVSRGVDFRCMFRKYEEFDCDISKWDVSNGKIFYNMFEECWKFDQDLSSWNLKSANDVTDMFKDCPSMKGHKLPPLLTKG